MSCDQFTDMFELYVIGSLEKIDAEVLRTHLDGGCEACRMRLNQALLQSALVSSTVPLVEPPPSLRDRIASSVKATTPVTVMPQKKQARPIIPWLVAAAAIIAMVVGISYEEKARQADVASLTASLEASVKENAQHTAAMLAILQAPGTKQVSFDVDKANLPHGNLFIHKELGVAMVVAHLPAAPEGWKYESWIVPKSGAPRPIESFKTDQNGLAFTVVKGPVDVSQWAAMAVSLEPENSTPVKPTKVVFASPV